MAHTVKNSARIACWVLAVLVLLVGLIGFCTPLGQLSPLAEKATAWNGFLHFIAANGLPLMQIGLGVLAFRVLLLPFLLDAGKAKAQWKVFFRKLPLTSFLIPGALCMFFLSYLPMPGIVLAFKNFVRVRRGTIIDSIAESLWVGLGNFAFIGTERVQSVIRNTFVYNFFWMILGLVVSVSLAIALSHLRNRRAVKLYQTSIFMPYFLSWVIASYLLYALLSYDRGLIRSITVGLGLYTHDTYPNFYLRPSAWPAILTLANQWKYMGYNSIVYSAAITGIDGELYEAATLDGAGTWGKIRYVTLPMLKPMMIILTIMAMGRMANADFGLFYNLPMGSGPLMQTTEVFDTYVFRMLTGGTANMGVTAAASLFQSVLGFVLIFTSNMVVRRVSPDNSLF